LKEAKNKPEITKPGTAKPGITTPETTKPETTKPEIATPETTKPETTTPRITPPEVDATLRTFIDELEKGIRQLTANPDQSLTNGTTPLTMAYNAFMRAHGKNECLLRWEHGDKPAA
jgi:hypothetical protein